MIQDIIFQEQGRIGKGKGYNFEFRYSTMHIASDTSRNGQAYVNFRMACHLTYELSIGSTFLRSKHMVPGSRAKKPGTLIFHKEVDNLALAL